MSTPRRTFKERMMDPRNRRSKNIEDRTDQSVQQPPFEEAPEAGWPVSGGRPDLNRPIDIETYMSRISPESARVDRLRADMAVKNRGIRRKVKFPSPSKPK